MRKSLPRNAAARFIWGKVLVLLSGWFTADGMGQEPPLSNRYFAKTWQTEEGLPDNAINDLAQTPEGYLWMATLSGLVRFDGAHFRVFTAANTAGLYSGQVRGLFVAEDGAMWIAAGQGGVSCLRGGKFSSLGAPAGISPFIVQDMAALPDGDVVTVAWSTAQIHRIRGDRVSTFQHPERNEGNKGSHWVREKSGRVWLANGNRLQAMDLSGQGRDWSSAEGEIRATGSSRGGLWLTAGGKLLHWDTSREPAAMASLPETRVHALMEDRKGAVWIGTQGAGLYRFSKGLIERVETSHGNIQTLLEDAEGSIWAGTGGGGLNQIRERRFDVRNEADGLANPAVSSVCEDDEGVVWAVTLGGTACWWEPGETKARKLDFGIEAAATSITRATGGGVWIGTDGNGLWRARAGLAERVLEGNSAVNYSPMLYSDRRGNLWIGSVEGLLCMKDGALRTVAANDVLAGGVRAMVEDANGTLWVGAGDGLLHRFGTGQREDFGPADGLPGAVIRCLLAGKDGSVWAGTDGGGLIHWKNGKFTQFTTRHGLMEDVIVQIQADDAGSLWCGSPRGLFRVPTEQLAEVTAGRRGKAECVYYGRSEGMPDYRYASDYHPRSATTRDGRLLFSTLKGLVILDPRKLHPDLPAPPVVLQGLRVDGAPVLGEGGIASSAPASLEIGPHAERLQFDLAIPSYAYGDRIRVRYRMEGIETAWRETVPGLPIEYFHLPSGSYRFRATAANGDGRWNENGVSLAFVLAPPFWQRLWFLIPAAVLLIAGIAAFARWLGLLRLRQEMRRLRARHELERERTRIARDMHDSLGAGLTQISLLAELACAEAQTVPKAVSRLQVVSERSRYLMQALDEIVWAVNPRNDNVIRLVDYILQFAVDFLRTAEIDCRQDVPEDFAERPMQAETRHHLFLAVKESLNNVVRHARATAVELQIQTDGDALVLRISDNGCGFSMPGGELPVGGGNGLRNIQERLAGIGGSCEITSKLGAGTQVRLRAPLS